jgi:hypothetical protein
MPSTASIAREDILWVCARICPAALLTRMSSGRLAQIVSIIASTASGTRTSQPIVSISPPVSFASSPAVCFSTSSRRPQITTLAPSSR